MSLGVAVPKECEIGYYCPRGTKYATQFGCLEGTYGDRKQLASSDLCVACDGGQFCGRRGLKEPSGPCLAGFYCVSNATISAPQDGVTGNICPLGHYCPSNTTDPIKCDEGSYGPEEGNFYYCYFGPVLFLFLLKESVLSKKIENYSSVLLNFNGGSTLK